MRTTILILLTIAAATPAFAQAGVKAELNDLAIKTRIETAFLLNDQLSVLNIQTHCDHGVVTLSGGVVDDVQRRLAEDIARGVEGVTEVVNKLVVMDAPVLQPPKRTWKQVVEDATIEAAIRSRLLYHKQLKGLKIDIHAHNNVVTLAGVVATESQRDEIGRIAYDTRGVNAIDNQLVVRPKDAETLVGTVARDISDEWVEKRIESAILMNRYISVRDLHIEVDDGVCILVGTVGNEQQRALTASIASSVEGVRTVQNNIRVAAEPQLAPVEPEMEPLAP